MQRRFAVSGACGDGEGWRRGRSAREDVLVGQTEGIIVVGLESRVSVGRCWLHLTECFSSSQLTCFGLGCVGVSVIVSCRRRLEACSKMNETKGPANEERAGWQPQVRRQCGKVSDVM